MTDFIQFASSHGLIIKRLPLCQVTRCQTESHLSKRNGAFFFDGEWGWLQNWEIHDTPVIWKSDKVTNHTALQERIEKSTQKYNQERIKNNADAAKKAQWMLSRCELNLSVYLARKGFPEMCGNIWACNEQRLLVVPMYKDKTIVGCQLIDNEGNKKFLKGQVTQDACFQIGNGKQAFFVEGYASGLSLQVILQSLKISYTIYVTFSAGNLGRFAKRINGIVIADNDVSGVGEKVALDSGKRYWMPPVTGFDINDYHVNYGVFKAAQEIKKLIYSKP